MKGNKKIEVGTKFYSDIGLKAVTVHLPKDVHGELVKMAIKDDRSLQKTVRRILVEYVEKSK